LSLQNIEAFYKQALKNPHLLRGLETATDGPSFGRIAVDLGKAAGFEFTPDEAQSWVSEKFTGRADGELVDEELEAVAGGKGSPVSFRPSFNPLSILNGNGH
jgi:predicted ribosomally synthesized peptide with nif11-like leader